LVKQKSKVQLFLVASWWLSSSGQRPLTVNQEIGGSNPLNHPIPELVQLVEHLAEDQVVLRSTRRLRTKEKEMIWVVLSAVWALCFVIHWGLDFAYWQSKYPELANQDYRKDLVYAIGMSIGGPLSLLGRALYSLSRMEKFYWGFRLW
jgi:hypothetical protein